MYNIIEKKRNSFLFYCIDTDYTDTNKKKTKRIANDKS